MEITTIDGQNVPVWQRPGSGDPAGKPHPIEETLRGSFGRGAKPIETALLPQWQRSFLDPELARIAPLVRGVFDASSKARNFVNPDLTPEARARHQRGAVEPSLHRLGEALAVIIEAAGQQYEAAEAFAVQLPEPPKSGNEALLYQLQAQELRGILRGMSEEAREAYVKRQVELGNLVALQAVAGSPDAILSPSTLEGIKRERIKRAAPWVDAKRADLRALVAATVEVAQRIYGGIASGVRQSTGMEMGRPAALEQALRFAGLSARKGVDPESAKRRAAYMYRAARAGGSNAV